MKKKKRNDRQHTMTVLFQYVILLPEDFCGKEPAAGNMLEANPALPGMVRTSRPATIYMEMNLIKQEINDYYFVPMSG